MKSQWGILVFEEETFTTVSITGTLVHSHPVADQLKWSHYEDYLFLKNRSSPLSPVWELSTLVHFHTVTDQLKWSHNEEYLFLKKRCSPLSPLQELRNTLTLLRISWNEVTMKITCIWRRDIHHRSTGAPQAVVEICVHKSISPVPCP